MPKAKAIASLSGMIDSDMEEPSDVDMMPTPDSNQENAEPAKKAPGRPKATAAKGRKTKPASRRLSGGPKPKVAAKKKASTKRAPLKEQTNEEKTEEIEEVDEFMDEIPDTINKPEAAVSEEEADELVQTKKQPAKRGRAAAKAKQPPKNDPVEHLKIVENDGEFEYTPTAAKQSKLASKKPAAGKRQASAEPKPFEKVIPETQPIPVESDSSALQEAEEEEIPQSVYRQSNLTRASSKQVQPQVARRRGGSASDTERGGTDPALRRKLGEMTKKFENLDLKYRNLREVGIKEAEANFEKLKTQSEERTKGTNSNHPTTSLHGASQLIKNPSRHRPHRLPQKRTRHPKIPRRADPIPPHHPRLHRIHPLHRPSPHHPAQYLPHRSPKRDQSPQCQTRRLPPRLRVHRIGL